MSNDNVKSILDRDLEDMNDEELKDLWTLRKVMSETNKNYLECQKLYAETANLNANTANLHAQTVNLNEATQTLSAKRTNLYANTNFTNKRNYWFIPLSVIAISMGVGAIITKLFFVGNVVN